MKCLIIFVLILCFMITGNLLAQKGMIPLPSKPQAGENRWAVIIGINDYKDQDIVDLKFAVADAKDLYDLLTDKNYGGFKVENVNLLTDNTTGKPTRENILLALMGLENVADEDDTIFIAFSGHGIEESGVSYFIPSDANISIIRDTGIPMERFTDTLKRTKARVQVMFFDACHSGVRKDKGISGQIGKDEFSRIFTKADGRAILSSCDANETSYEIPEEGHGVFTNFLIEALKGNADRDNDGLITVSEVSNYVTAKVKEWSFQNGKRQNPRLEYNVSGEIVLTQSLPGVAVGPTIKGKVDGAEMVPIPAGEFLIGSNDGNDDEKPIHTVYLDAFYMDKYEVTNAQYKKFMDETGHPAPQYWNDSHYNAPNQPVVGVKWEDAKAYADWAGERLPTEAEWEKAARGGLVGKKYVWGDRWPLPNKEGNFDDSITNDGYAYTAPVGSFKPNGYGLYDMAGNVCEWCADWYDINYYVNSPKSNPTGPSSGQRRVLRGGSWLSNISRLSLRVAARNYTLVPTIAFYYLVGFRCVE